MPAGPLLSARCLLCHPQRCAAPAPRSAPPAPQAVDAATGMLYLHSRAVPLLHRDLRSPNLLVAEGFRVKVGGGPGALPGAGLGLPAHAAGSWAACVRTQRPSPTTPPRPDRWPTST